VFKDDLAPYEVKKSTIRFPLSQPVPVKLIGRIAKFRAKEVVEREKAKPATPKKRYDRASGVRKGSMHQKKVAPEVGFDTKYTTKKWLLR
jgi:hypothetical protein